MGCWNKTCAVTQLPIHAGDETVLFYIVSRRRGRAMPSSQYDTGWSLLPIPFYGTYDDYGFQDNHPGQEGKYTFLGEMVWQFTEMDFHDTVRAFFKDSESLVEAIREDKEYGNTRISAVMISRDVWDSLSSNYKPEDYVSKNPISCQTIAEHYAKLFPLLRTAGGYPEYHFERRPVIRGYLKEHFLEHPDFSTPESVVYRFIDSIEFINGYHEGTVFATHQAGIDGVISPEECARMQFFLAALDILRIAIVPQIGEGSQVNIDHYYHNLRVKLMQDRIAHDKSLWDDEEELDEEE